LKVGIRLLWASVAVLVGFIVLLGYFVTTPFLTGLRTILMQWAVILAAAALFLGLFNLFTVHWNKVNDQTEGWPYSAVLIFCFLVTLTLGLIFGPDFSGMFDTNFNVMQFLFDYVQLPIESALMALLAVSLVVAGFRLLSQRRNVFSLIFIGSAILALLGSSPWIMGSASGPAQWIGNVAVWVAQVWSVAGARGILLGVALGAAATGLRILIGSDRPYGE
jgi:hypothetical protein